MLLRLKPSLYRGSVQKLLSKTFTGVVERLDDCLYNYQQKHWGFRQDRDLLASGLTYCAYCYHLQCQIERDRFGMNLCWLAFLLLQAWQNEPGQGSHACFGRTD